MITAKEVKDFRLRSEKHAENEASVFLDENDAKVISLISNFLLDQAMKGKTEVNFYGIIGALREKVSDYKVLPVYTAKKVNNELKTLLKSYDFQVNDDKVFWG